MTAPSIKEALEPVLSFLDELAANAVSGKRQALNPIVIGGSAKLYAEGLRAALATFQPSGERRESIARVFAEAIGCSQECTLATCACLSHADDAILASGLVQDEAAHITDYWGEV